MTRTLLDKLDRHWDDFDRNIMNFFKYTQTTAFPYYDIVKLEEEGNYEVRLALAGYSKEDIEIEQKEQTLSIKGKKTSNAGSETFLVRGISKSEFVRTFALPVDAVVKSATMRDGILTVGVSLPKKQDRTIKISVD